jgi:hypothetical protein
LPRNQTWSSLAYVPFNRARPQVAIVGSGLAGEALAARLSVFCDVTVYERGSARGTYAPDVLSADRSLGLRCTINYGLGGTTAL